MRFPTLGTTNPIRKSSLQSGQAEQRRCGAPPSQVADNTTDTQAEANEAMQSRLHRMMHSRTKIIIVSEHNNLGVGRYCVPLKPQHAVSLPLHCSQHQSPVPERDALPPLEAFPQQQLHRTGPGASRKFAVFATIGTILPLASVIPLCFTFSSVQSWHMV